LDDANRRATTGSEEEKATALIQAEVFNAVVAAQKA
jgi:hypothetical protein